MKIHFGLILFVISSSLFAASEAEGGNRQIEETEEKKGISVEVETLNVQLKILSLLEQIKEQNNEVIKEISNGQKEVTKHVRENTKEISNGLKENTKQAKENIKVIEEISNGLKEITKQGRKNMKEISTGLKENTKQTEENTKIIKEISNGPKENTKKTEENTKIMKEILNGLKENTKQAKENIKVVEEISNGLKEITMQVRENRKEISNVLKDNNKVIKNFISEIKDNTNGIKENTDETKKNTSNIKDIVNKIGKNNEEEKEVISEIKEIINDIKQETNGLKEIVDVVTNSTDYIKIIKDYFAPAKNCNDLHLKGDENSGIRTVHPYLYSPRKSIDVLCDQQTEGGGWTVFQLRENLSERENFERNWKNYSHGFGNLNGEFWMGLELINVMTKLDVMELRVDLEDDTGEKRFAKYESFSVEDEDEKFKLNIGSYGGTVGDSLRYHNQRPFTTMDQDNDEWPFGNCAVDHKGAWWHDRCDQSNLNGYPHVGEYSSSLDDGIEWNEFRAGQNSMAKTKDDVSTFRKN